MKNKMSLTEEFNKMKKLAGILKEEHPFDAPPHDAAVDLPQNKKTINTKLSTKSGIKNAIYKILEVGGVEGRYHDENWEGINKFRNALEEVGAEVDLVKSAYEGHGTVKDYESVPTKKVYLFNVMVRDKKGNMITIPYKVTCAFVGRTGTMSDDVYELTYYAMA
jgi:cytochrome c556